MMDAPMTFSPWTADPAFLRAFAQAIPRDALLAQQRFAQAVWAAQVQWAEAIGSAAISAQWSMLDAMQRTATRAL